MEEFFYVVNSGGAVFVKEGAFFRSQVEDSHISGHGSEWVAHWDRIEATSIERARVEGAKLAIDKGEYVNENSCAFSAADMLELRQYKRTEKL